MPILARRGFDNPGFFGFLHQSHTFELNLENQSFEVARQHDIAAATKYKFLGIAQLRVG